MTLFPPISIHQGVNMSSLDYLLDKKTKELQEELKESKAVIELCYAMMMGSVLLNVVLVWRLFSG
jgi:hypothetical protein